MNFSTQFEKPCYVNHSFQLPSRRNSRAVEAPLKCRMVSQRGHELNCTHLLWSSLHPWSRAKATDPTRERKVFLQENTPVLKCSDGSTIDLHIKVIQYGQLRKRERGSSPTKCDSVSIIEKSWWVYQLSSNTVSWWSAFTIGRCCPLSSMDSTAPLVMGLCLLSTFDLINISKWSI